jgi:hypothetical protein
MAKKAIVYFYSYRRRFADRDRVLIETCTLHSLVSGLVLSHGTHQLEPRPSCPVTIGCQAGNSPALPSRDRAIRLDTVASVRWLDPRSNAGLVLSSTQHIARMLYSLCTVKSGTGTGERPRPRANRGRRSRPRPRANRGRGRARGPRCPRPCDSEHSALSLSTPIVATGTSVVELKLDRQARAANLKGRRAAQRSVRCLELLRCSRLYCNNV